MSVIPNLIGPQVLMPGGREVERRLDGSRYVNERRGLSVIVSKEEHAGRQWLHLSCVAGNRSAGRMPSWEELREVKNLFLGRECLAVQVLPRESRYVNINPYCLHLWTCLDGDVVPDFAQGGNSL